MKTVILTLCFQKYVKIVNTPGTLFLCGEWLSNRSMSRRGVYLLAGTGISGLTVFTTHSDFQRSRLFNGRPLITRFMDAEPTVKYSPFRSISDLAERPLSRFPRRDELIVFDRSPGL